jgi:hypothetical protein
MEVLVRHRQFLSAADSDVIISIATTLLVGATGDERFR